MAGLKDYMGGILQAGLQQAGGVASTIIGNVARRKAADTAYQRNLAQWHRENKYNDPSQQMARLKAAGLNPNMVYGTGVQAAGPAGSAPAAPVPGVQDVPVLANYMDARLKAEQARSIQLSNMKEEIDLGIRKPEYYKTGQETEMSAGTEPGGTITLYYDTDNLYYKRQRDLTETAGYNKRVAKLGATLADNGFTIRDPKLLRMLSDALADSKYDLSDLTKPVIEWLLKKVGVSTK